MRLNRILSFAAAASLAATCFFTWLVFPSKGLSFRGIDEIKVVIGITSTKEINWGRPAYFHLVLATVFLLFSFIQKSWARWFRVGAAAFNGAWMVRNFFLLPACGGGTDCPERAVGLYLLLAASLLLFFASTVVAEEKKP